MDAPLIAKVRFELYPGEISGKTRGYLSTVRPNHYIAELGYTVIGKVDFEGDLIELGETRAAVITYAYHEPFERILSQGLRYEVREGSRTVGQVEVVEIARRD